MKSVRTNSASQPSSVPEEDEEVDVFDSSVHVPLTADSPPKPSDACDIDVVDATAEEMVTIDVSGSPPKPAGATNNRRVAGSLDQVVADVSSPSGGKTDTVLRQRRHAPRKTHNALIALSSLGDQGPVDSCINTLSLEIQVAFRVKVLGLFTLHLLALSLLVIIFTYSPLTTDSLTRFANNDTGTALGGSVILSLVVLCALYAAKHTCPFNFVLLCVFTCIEAIAVTAFGLFFDTKASVLACLVCFFVMVFMTFFSTRRRFVKKTRHIELCHSVVAGIAAYVLVTTVACVAFGARGTGLMSGTTFGLTMLFAFPVIMWFAFDAHCMYQIMTPDEYMSGVIFFYTDLVLFLLFVVVMIVCIAACDGGAPMACFGGSCGVNIDPEHDTLPPPQPDSVGSPSTASSPVGGIETV
ncbi:hypothetical protein DYB36_009756 [Aphanomyces astaci]|uniref:Uncharacterized protein n=1 Tax=Aphanomyces astaci TaxID=112090 RepID=A0A397B331_APHAT|nr:hypothetical protein DYB36_009756 [Aphanomyces astaci]